MGTQKRPVGQISKVSSSRVPPDKCQITPVIRPALVCRYCQLLGTPRVCAGELLDCVYVVALQIISWEYICKAGFLEVKDKQSILRCLSSHSAATIETSSNTYEASTEEVIGTTATGLPRSSGTGISRMQIGSGLYLDSRGETCIRGSCERYYFNWLYTCTCYLTLVHHITSRYLHHHLTYHTTIMPNHTKS